MRHPPTPQHSIYDRAKPVNQPITSVNPSKYLVEARGLRVGGGGRVGVAEEGLDGGEDGRDVVDGGPLVLQDVCGWWSGRFADVYGGVEAGTRPPSFCVYASIFLYVRFARTEADLPVVVDVGVEHLG